MIRARQHIRAISFAYTNGRAVIGFLACDVAVVSEDAGFNKKRNRAEGGAARWLHFEGRPAFVAKSRFELPPKLLCPKDFDVGTSLASIFPKVAPGAKVRSTPKHIGEV